MTFLELYREYYNLFNALIEIKKHNTQSGLVIENTKPSCFHHLQSTTIHDDCKDLDKNEIISKIQSRIEEIEKYTLK